METIYFIVIHTKECSYVRKFAYRKLEDAKKDLQSITLKGMQKIGDYQVYNSETRTTYEIKSVTLIEN